MAKGTIVIEEKRCAGCGLCAEFCSRGCLVVSSEKVSFRGLPIASFAHPEKCTGCGICGWMCPDFAIEVYRLVAAPSTTG